MVAISTEACTVSSFKMVFFFTYSTHTKVEFVTYVRNYTSKQTYLKQADNIEYNNKHLKFLNTFRYMLQYHSSARNLAFQPSCLFNEHCAGK